MIPITSLHFDDETISRVISVLKSGNIAQGPVVQELEERFADKLGVKHAIALNNGTTALSVALEAMNITKGDEIVTSPFTFVATINAALEVGAKVRFVDISEEDFNVCPNSLESVVSQSTKALIPVHLFGQISDMDSIAKKTAEKNIRILEDASQSHFSMQNAKMAGSYDVGTFSLYATKNITSGEGGIVTTNDDSVAAKIKLLRNQGMKERYVYEAIGHNYRLTDLQAAIVLPQLERYEETVRARAYNANYYSSSLKGLPGLILPREILGRRHVWHQYTLRVTGDAPINRSELAVKLSEAGIASGIYYPKLISEYPIYRDHPDVEITPTPMAKKIASEVISIPVHGALSPNEIEYIAETITKIFGTNNDRN